MRVPRTAEVGLSAGRAGWAGRLCAVPAFEPFRAVRYAATHDLARVTAPPYDVLSEADVDELAARDPHNVVHVDVPRGGDERYSEAAITLNQWLADGDLVTDDVRHVHDLPAPLHRRDRPAPRAERRPRRARGRRRGLGRGPRPRTHHPQGVHRPPGAHPRHARQPLPRLVPVRIPRPLRAPRGTRRAGRYRQRRRRRARRRTRHRPRPPAARSAGPSAPRPPSSPTGTTGMRSRASTATSGAPRAATPAPS